MNIVFVCHTNFRGNSGIQLFHLANALVGMGCAAICVVPDGKESIADCGLARFTACNAEEALEQGLVFPNGAPPDLIHAWTPREHVRKIVEPLARRYDCPVMMHLEDNEELLTASRIGLDVAGMKLLSAEDLDRRIPGYVSHPVRSLDLMRAAIGTTILAEPLRAFVPKGIPVQVFPPSCDSDLFHPMAPDAGLRATLGIAPDEIVITYNGNVHPANRLEVRSLYLSVLFLNRMGHKTKLIRLGSGIDCMENVAAELAPNVIDLGVLPNRVVPKYLALATVLVQPGAPGAFNDYRVPAKLPEFLAMGKPVILPRCNLGSELTHGENCLLLELGHAGEIVDRIMTVKANPQLAARLGAGARRFFDSHLSWGRSAGLVLGFYEAILGDRRAKNMIARSA